MKIGNLVKHRMSEKPAIGFVVDIVQKKVWRASIHGRKVDWSKVNPEPHAVVLFPHNSGTINIPTCELEVVSEV
tara:strand:+ start:302 stop:523 length:222 start_codon:yes stop_codon:yes gene_type:complete